MILYGTSRNSTDEEFSKYLSEINEITLKYVKQETSKKSKTRRITLISVPTNEVILWKNKDNGYYARIVMEKLVYGFARILCFITFFFFVLNVKERN